MKLVNFLIIFMLVYICEGKKNLQALTDASGQDVIEIGTPLKEFPPGVEEEPSADPEEETTDEAARPTSASKSPVSKDGRRAMDGKTRVATTTKNALNDKDDSEETSSQEDEEARIEKELAEIYKDTDYKAESTPEVSKEVNVTETEDAKPIARTRNKSKWRSLADWRRRHVYGGFRRRKDRAADSFKFQPDVNSPQDIERFRTSVDDIACERRVTQRLNSQASRPTGHKVMDVFQFGVLILSLCLFD